MPLVARVLPHFEYGTVARRYLPVFGGVIAVNPAVAIDTGWARW